MNRRLVYGYQMLTGFSDSCTGLLLVFAPGATIRLMGLHVSVEILPFLSWIGAFVFSVGLACLYGAFLSTRAKFAEKLEVVWLLTGITRACVALFLGARIAAGVLGAGWATVAAADGSIALIQAIGLSKGWLANAEA